MRNEKAFAWRQISRAESGTTIVLGGESHRYQAEESVPTALPVLFVAAQSGPPLTKASKLACSRAEHWSEKAVETAHFTSQVGHALRACRCQQQVDQVTDHSRKSSSVPPRQNSQDCH